MRPVTYLNTTFFTDTVTREERMRDLQDYLSEADEIERVASWLVVGACITFVLVVWVAL